MEKINIPRRRGNCNAPTTILRNVCRTRVGIIRSKLLRNATRGSHRADSAFDDFQPNDFHIHTRRFRAFADRCVHGCDRELRRVVLPVRQPDFHVGRDLLSVEEDQHVGEAQRERHNRGRSFFRILIGSDGTRTSHIAHARSSPTYVYLRTLYILMRYNL